MRPSKLRLRFIVVIIYFKVSAYLTIASSSQKMNAEGPTQGSTNQATIVECGEALKN